MAPKAVLILAPCAAWQHNGVNLVSCHASKWAKIVTALDAIVYVFAIDNAVNYANVNATLKSYIKKTRYLLKVEALHIWYNCNSQFKLPCYHSGILFTSLKNLRVVFGRYNTT